VVEKYWFRDNQNMRFIFFPFLFVSQNCAVYELMQKNMTEPDRPQMTIQCGTEKINFAMPVD
jgi:hypothetical protein